MGKVVIKIKALPKDVSQNIEKLRDDLKSFLAQRGTVYKIEAQPLAFGLNVVFVTLITDEAEGTSKLEADFLKFKDADLSITDVSRMPDI